MLGRIANKIPTFEIKGKNVIEFYPGFGLLSTRWVFKLFCFSPIGPARARIGIN